LWQLRVARRPQQNLVDANRLGRLTAKADLGDVVTCERTKRT
jgi:hypothetical protein